LERDFDMTKFLAEGDVILLTKDHVVTASVPYHFAYQGHKGNFKNFARVQVRLSDDNFDYLRGIYIVTKTATDGGGTGHGPGDVYPDGHHVHCISEDGKKTVDFYQSGSFIDIIKDIEPIRRAELTWKIKDIEPIGRAELTWKIK